MGVENNEAVIATTWKDECIDKIKAWIASRPEKQQKLFVFVNSLENGKTTVFLAPDGSKKGWDTAEEIERLRDEFIGFLKTFDYEDGSSPINYVEVGYGEFGQKVLRGNCRNMYDDRDYAA